MTADAASSPASTVASAPTSLASSSADSRVSTAMTCRDGQRFEDLDREVAEAADADDHDGRVRRQLRQHSLHGAVGRQPGVGQRRRDHRVQVADRHQPPRIVHQQVLGHPAVDAEPDARRPLEAVDAEVLRAGRAGLASPAAVQPVDGDRLAFLDTAHARADRVNPAGVLVADHEWWSPRRHAFLELVHDVQVGVAQPRAADLDDDLARAGLRVGQVDAAPDRTGIA